jgi:hypothetical protein
MRRIAMASALTTAIAALAVVVVAAPPARAQQALLEVIEVPASGTRVVSTTVLRPGSTYVVTVSATVQMTYPGGRTESLDALHCFAHAGGAPIPGDDCSESPPGPGKVSPLFLDLGGGPQQTLDGLNGQPLAYAADHAYTARIEVAAPVTLGARVRSFLNATPAGTFVVSLYGPPAPGAPAPPAPAVPPDSILGQHPIVGPPLFRIIAVSRLEPGAGFVRPPAGGLVRPQAGLLLGEGDEVTVGGGAPFATLTLQALPSGAIFTLSGSASRTAGGALRAHGVSFTASAAPQLTTGELAITTAASRTRQEHQRLPAGGPAFVLTPVARVDADGGDVHVAHDPARRRTTVRNLRGAVTVTPASRPALRLAPGRQVDVTAAGAGRPVALVPADLATGIPSPRDVRAGPAVATAPSVISLRSLRRSKCVTVLVASAKPARVLVTIFSGRRSIRLFGQRLVVFTAPGRRDTCIRVPARAKTFDVRTPLRFAVGYALGARPRRGEPVTRPAIRPVRLVP